MHLLLSFILSVNPSTTTAVNKFSIIMLMDKINERKIRYDNYVLPQSLGMLSLD